MTPQQDAIKSYMDQNGMASGNLPDAGQQGLALLMSRNANNQAQATDQNQAIQQAQQEYQMLSKGGNASGNSNVGQRNSFNSKLMADFNGSQNTILPGQTQITQQFGNYNPNLETFSGGYARDTNFAANFGSPLAAPPGNWKVSYAYNTANPNGQPGDGSNEGYGNAVMLENTQTGEKLHFIHLSQVGVQPGQTVKGGSIIAATGNSGNSTGPNLGVEYYNAKGQLGNVLNSNYAQYFPLGQ